MQAHLYFFHHFLVSHREQDFADGDLGSNFISDTGCIGYPGDLPLCIELYQKKKLNAFKTPWISGLSMRQVGLNNLKERHLVSHPSHDLLRMSIRMFITSILSKEGTEFPWAR